MSNSSEDMILDLLNDTLDKTNYSQVVIYPVIGDSLFTLIAEMDKNIVLITVLESQANSLS